MVASCSPIVDARGHNYDETDLSQLVAGQSTADDVRALLGSPTTISNFGEETWYYITQKQERVGFFAPEVTEQHVMAMAFDKEGKLLTMERFAKEQGKPVQMVSKKTPTEGHDLTFIEQMLGNLGRFNSSGRGISDRNMGR